MLWFVDSMILFGVVFIPQVPILREKHNQSTTEGTEVVRRVGTSNSAPFSGCGTMPLSRPQSLTCSCLDEKPLESRD